MIVTAYTVILKINDTLPRSGRVMETGTRFPLETTGTQKARKRESAALQTVPKSMSPYKLPLMG